MGARKKIRTDNKALSWLKRARTRNTVLARWNDEMVLLGLPLDHEDQDSLEYINWTIEHRAGNWHANADGLSRRGPVAKDHHDCPACSGGMKSVAVQTETDEGEDCIVVAQTKLLTQINLLQDWQSLEKTTNVPQHPLMPIQVVYCNQRVHLDYAGPLRPSSKGSLYLLVMVNAFSGYVCAAATKDQTAATTLDFLMKYWVTQFGLPDWIMTDRGVQFESGLMQLICNQFGIKKTRTISYHPAGNGRAEVAVKMIKQQLAVHCAQTAADWEEGLPFCLMTLRSGINTSTGYSPAELFLGKPIRCATDISLDLDTKPLAADQSAYQTKLNQRLLLTQDWTREQLIHSKATQKKSKESGVYVENIRVGSLILIVDK